MEEIPPELADVYNFQELIKLQDDFQIFCEKKVYRKEVLMILKYWVNTMKWDGQLPPTEDLFMSLML